jgi:hypothetical protein
MTTANFVETPPTETAPQPAPSSRRPADYYSSPPGTRIFPQWVPFGCGGASVLVLLIVFLGGSYLAGGGFTDLMDMMFGMTMGEMRGMYQADVQPAHKEQLEAEIKTMREHLRTERISVQSLQPLLQTMQKATADEKLTADEVGKILTATRRVNSSAKPK